MVYLVTAEVVHDLVHRHEQLSAIGDLTDDLVLHPDVVALMLAEQSTVGANADPILDADDLKLALVQGTQIFT